MHPTLQCRRVRGHARRLLRAARGRSPRPGERPRRRAARTPPSTPSGTASDRSESSPSEQPIGAERGEHRDRQRHQKERHARGAHLLHHRHQLVPQPVERRVPAERDEQKQHRDRAERAGRVRRRAPVATPSGGEHHHDGAEILGVQLEEVAAPVVLQHAVELREDGGDDLLGRHRERRGVVPPRAGSAGAARRVRDVGRNGKTWIAAMPRPSRTAPSASPSSTRPA